MTAVPLEARDIVAGYGRQAVLRGVSLTVPEGSVVGIVGPNGHGKTTLMRAIAGTVPVTAGAVQLAGQPVTDWSAWRRARTGLVHIPQGDHLFLDMSVEENLRLGALVAPASEQRDRLAEVYALLPRLEERRQQTAGTLSGGERRMLALGRGLMARGRLLIIDEPSLGLAPVVIEQVYAFLFRLKAAQRTIVIVEESPARLASLAEDISLIDNGRVVWRGSGDELLGADQMLETYLGT